MAAYYGKGSGAFVRNLTVANCRELLEDVFPGIKTEEVQDISLDFYSEAPPYVFDYHSLDYHANGASRKLLKIEVTFQNGYKIQSTIQVDKELQVDNNGNVRFKKNGWKKVSYTENMPIDNTFMYPTAAGTMIPPPTYTAANSAAFHGPYPMVTTPLYDDAMDYPSAVQKVAAPKASKKKPEKPKPFQRPKRKIILDDNEPV